MLALRSTFRLIFETWETAELWNLYLLQTLQIYEE
jgi:hypothetical protein